MLRVILLVGFVSPTFVFSTASAQDNRLLRAGAAKVEISPPLGEMVVGGFAPFPATKIHDPLYAKCLVLDNGEDRVALVICDNLGITREVYDEAREKIAERSDFPTRNILMAATHTHSGTRARMPKYRPIVVNGITNAVLAAIKTMEPAQIAWGGAHEPSELFNRRWYVTDPELLKNPFGKKDKVRMNPPRGNGSLVKPAGPVDPEISFISVRAKTGRPIALLANYSLHYVGGVNKGDVSADYFGIFSQRISGLLGADHPGPKMVAMLSNGTSGDVNNINFRQRGGKRYQRYEKMAEVAEKVAQKVYEAHASLTFHDWVPLGSASRDLTLKVRKPDEAMRKYFEEILAKPEDAPKHHRYERNYAARVKALGDGPDEITVPLQALRVGDLGIAAIPFEVFTEIGLEIKDRSPFANAFTIELANSSHGYLPTPAQHELGGYETWMGTNRVQLDASEKITAVILDLMKELKQEPLESNRR